MPKAKPKKKVKSKAGRPKVVVDWTTVDAYLKAHCDGVEIAGVLGIAPISLYRACQRDKKVNFDAYSQQKKMTGKALLKFSQFQSAMGTEKHPGNVTMSIWLGKNWLGQRETPENKSDKEPMKPPDFTFIAEDMSNGNNEVAPETN